MKLADVFVKFHDPKDSTIEKFVSLEHLLVFKIEPLDDFGVAFVLADSNLYTWSNTSRGWRFIPIASFNVYAADKKG